MARTVPIEERFWAKVDRSGGPDACWPWLGYRNRQGYGQTSVNRRPRPAHRVAWQLTFGPIPDGKPLDHFRCDNPPCCNPTHLRPVMPRENTLRSSGPSAWNAAKTRCPQGHPYEGENLMLEQGGKRRSCRECKRESYRRWRARNLEAARATELAAKQARRTSDPEARRAYDREWYARHRERLAGEARERRARKRLS